MIAWLARTQQYRESSARQNTTRLADADADELSEQTLVF
jgi:hypothetical protein